MIALKATEIDKSLGLIADIKDEKQEGLKQIGDLEKEILKLNSKISAVEDEKVKLNTNTEQVTDQIEKIEKKRKNTAMRNIKPLIYGTAGMTSPCGLP